MELETSKASHATPMFGGKRKWQLLKRDKSTSRDFVARLAASQPKKLALLAKKLVRSTCSKSSVHPVYMNVA